jgi:glycolate oxidase iron-sulfur subunit
LSAVSEQAQPGRAIFTSELLDRCISCGFCLPACPTYDLTGIETSSPRGRINLMRAIETGALPEDDPTVMDESAFCLGCRACEPVCPAGVQYGALLEEWRDRLWHGRRRPWRLRALLWTVDRVARVRVLGLLRRHAQTRRSGSAGAHLMLGCFERALYPQLGRCALTLAPELAAPTAQGCCGALHAHNGELERGTELARELGVALAGTIVTTSGGCAAHLAAVLGPERVQELSQWLTRRGYPSGAQPEGAAQRRPRVGFQDSCHLRNGLGGGASRGSCSPGLPSTSSFRVPPPAAAPPARTRSFAPTTARACWTAIWPRSRRPTST